MAPRQADPIRDESPVRALLLAPAPADQSQPRDRGAPEITGPASAETLNRGEGPISLEGAWFAKWGRSRAPSSAGRAATPQPLSNPTTNVACRSTAAARRRPSCCLIADPPRSRSSPVLAGLCPSRKSGTRLRRASRKKPLTVGHVTVDWRVHSTRRPLARRSGPWSNLMRLTAVSVQGHGAHSPVHRAGSGGMSRGGGRAAVSLKDTQGSQL